MLIIGYLSTAITELVGQFCSSSFITAFLQMIQKAEKTLQQSKTQTQSDRPQQHWVKEFSVS